MNTEMVQTINNSKYLFQELNYDWESILNKSSKITAALDNETNYCLMNFATLFAWLSEFELPKEVLDSAIDIWASCEMHGASEHALEIAWLVTLQPYLDEAISDEELFEYISQLPDEEKNECQKEFEKVEASKSYTLQFDLILDNLRQQGFPIEALCKTQLIWAHCIAFDIEPVTCTNIALHWLRDKYPT